MWAMFRELADDDAISEAVTHMRDELNPVHYKYADSGDHTNHAKRIYEADRVSMALFYLQHVKQQER